MNWFGPSGDCGCCNENCVDGDCQDYGDDWTIKFCDFVASSDYLTTYDHSDLMADLEGLFANVGPISLNISQQNNWIDTAISGFAAPINAVVSVSMPNEPYIIEQDSPSVSSTTYLRLYNFGVFIGAWDLGYCQRVLTAMLYADVDFSSDVTFPFLGFTQVPQTILAIGTGGTESCTAFSQPTLTPLVYSRPYPQFSGGTLAKQIWDSVNCNIVVQTGTIDTGIACP